MMSEYSRPVIQCAPWWRIWPVWAKQELLLLVREPVAIFFALVLPLVIYIFFGIPYAKHEVAEGVRFIDVMFPGLIVAVVANLLLMGLPIYLAELRSRGVDRRYAILPLPGWIFATAILAAMMCLVVVASAIVIAVVGLRDGLRSSLWASPLGLLMLGSVVWLSALGFFVGSLRVSNRTTQALSAVVFFTLFFGSGAAMPLDGLPRAFQSILEWNPLKQWAEVMVRVYTGMPVSRTQWLRLFTAIPLTAGCSIGGLALWRRR